MSGFCRRCGADSCCCGEPRRISQKTILHVNQANIRHNAKNPTAERKPVLIYRTHKGSKHTNQTLRIDGPCLLVYRHDKPLSCGAKVWIETASKVEVVGDAKK